MEVIVPLDDSNLVGVEPPQDEIQEKMDAEMDLESSLENVVLTMTNREQILDHSEAQEIVTDDLVSSSSSEEVVLEAKLENVDLKKILKNVFSDQDDEDVKLGSSSDGEYMLFKLLKEGTKELIDVNRIQEENEEEEIEVEFERVVKELDDHDVHCPKCNSCITKIVLRKKKRVNVKQPTGFNFFGCLSCFRVLVPSENCFSFLNFFGKPDPPLPTPGTVTNPSPSGSGDSKGKTVVDETVGRGTAAGKLPPKQQEVAAGAGGGGTDLFHNLFPPAPNGKNTGHHPHSQIPTSVINHGGGNPLLPGTSIAGGTSPGGDGVDIEAGLNSQGLEEPLLIPRARSELPLEILKSVVYGGLMETIVSLAVVTSAAAADSKTVSIVAMGLANLVAGLFALLPSIKELKKQQPEADTGVDRYQETLGRRENYFIHAMVVVLSFIVFGLIPPLTYGFSFRPSDDTDYKLVAVAAAAFLCIALLAIAKAYIQKVPRFHMYIQSVVYYVGVAIAGSGIAFVVGDLANRFMAEHGWFDAAVPAGLNIPETGFVKFGWGAF